MSLWNNLCFAHQRLPWCRFNFCTVIFLWQISQTITLDNVELLPPVDRVSLIEEYIKADVLFLHLNDYPAFEKVLPSKLFEYAAMRKPIWAGISGYSAKFVKAEIDNCEVFLPGNITDAMEKFDVLEFHLEPRNKFILKFNREKIMDEMALDILRFAKENA